MKSVIFISFQIQRLASFNLPPHPLTGARARLSSRTLANIALVLVVLLFSQMGLLRAAQAVEKVSVQGLFKDAALLVIDGKRRMLRAGQTSPEGVVLHSATSEGADIEVDGKRRQYSLGTQIGGGAKAPKRPKAHVYPDGNNMYAAVGSINGYPVNFIVDTGATLVSMNANDARRLGLDYRLIGDPATATTASGIAKIYLLNLKRVKLGEVELRNVRGAVHDGNFPKQILLGMSFLSRVDMRRSAGVLELEKKF